MIKRIFYTTIVLLLLVSCNSTISKVKGKIKKDMEAELTPEVKNIVSEWEYYNYAVPSNYWYNENTTWKEIAKDKFEHGIYKLSVLNDDIDKIKTTDSATNSAIVELKSEVSAYSTEIKKEMKRAEAFNDIFGIFGGSDAIINLLGAFSKDEKARLPAKIEKKFYVLNNCLDAEQTKLLQHLYRIEMGNSDSLQLTYEQKLEIRETVINKLKKEVKSESNFSKDELLVDLQKRLVSSYDSLFAVDKKN